MNKQLKKAVESELYALVNGALSVRNKTAAAEIAKHVKGAVKSLAKKFVKHIPAPAPAKKSKTARVVKKGAVKKAVSAKSKKVEKKVAVKVKSAKPVLQNLVKSAEKKSPSGK